MVALSILRIAIGVLLAVSGFFKLFEPYQNFSATIEIYDILSVPLTQFVAQTLPWIEVFTGVFLIMGIWLKFSLLSSWLMFTAFISVVGQAILRKLPIDSCGCFGDGVHLPPWVVLSMDICIWIFLTACIRNPQWVSGLSLDKKLER